MKKIIMLSFIFIAYIQAEQIDLGTIDVEANVETEIIKDIAGNEIKSADLAEALFKLSPSVSLVRRSGIANDIRVRGQKKDNINVSIDGTKVYGACPNRMDPPISHVLTNNVDFVEINEGPFTVEDFGVLSADVKVHTIKPKVGVEGEGAVNIGSFGYKKAAFSLSGGTEELKVLLSMSKEKGEQYEDGNGDDFVGQIDRNIVEGVAPRVAQYQSKYQNMDAFEKKTFMAKLYWDISEKQELKLSYTANRSDNILYPSTMMDALYDDSNIYNVEYVTKDLGVYSKELSLQVYKSDVEHPMSTKYRNVATKKGFYVTHQLSTEMTGAKLKNIFELDNHTLTVGLDHSMRNWDGGYLKNDKPLLDAKYHSIWDVDTKNTALFLSDEIVFGKLTLDLGLRYDNTKITSGNAKQQSNDYDVLNGYVFSTYKTDENTKYFAGFGKSSRVPDGKELYWIGLMGNPIGTPNLEATTNYELDLGIEKNYENITYKAKVFYSKLKNYIAYNASNKKSMMGNLVAWNTYENVDATVYGIELLGTYIATDSLYFDYGVAYQKGTKDNALKGQTGTNMPDIAPLKLNVAINYDYDNTFNLRAEVVAADAWDDFDAQNGEQALDAYSVLNLTATKIFSKNFEATVGVDNVLDETYAVSNTYKDLVLLTTEGSNNVMLMNEPGRYMYMNMRYKF